MSPIAGIQQHALTAYARAHAACCRLTDWALERSRPYEDGDDAGNYSTEMVVIIAGVVVLAIAVVAVISKKVLDKANSLNF